MNVKKYFTVFFLFVLPLWGLAQEIKTTQPDSLAHTLKDTLKSYADTSTVVDSKENITDTSAYFQQNNAMSPLEEINDTLPSVKDTANQILTQLNETKPPYLHQFRVGFDIAKLVFNYLNNNNTAYEIQADYRLRKDVYIAAESGWGTGSINKPELNYTTNSAYLRLGVEKSLLDRINKIDLDIAFFGFRYGLGIGKRSDATFLVPSPFGAPAERTSPGQNFVIHWGEMIAGVKTELWNGLYAGWTFRAKFLLNSGVFPELAPSFIAGYGRADKVTSFDFNFYLSYAIRWGKDDYDALQKKKD